MNRMVGALALTGGRVNQNVGLRPPAAPDVSRATGGGAPIPRGASIWSFPTEEDPRCCLCGAYALRPCRVVAP